jgi:hypothetical protein
MEDYIDVDAQYELRTHLEDEAAVGYEEWTRYNDDEAWAEEEQALQWEERQAAWPSGCTW